MNELIERLYSYHMYRKASDFRVSYEGQLPLQEYFDVLDRHFEVRAILFIAFMNAFSGG